MRKLTEAATGSFATKQPSDEELERRDEMAKGSW